MSLGMVVEGAVQGLVLVAVALLLSGRTRDVIGRALLAAILIGAAAMYVVFAAVAGESAGWLVVEALGVAVFGAMALLSVRGSSWWLVAGWALHPIWDVVLHVAGPGREFAPDWYAVTCLGFDLIVAAGIAVAYGTGFVGRQRTRRFHRRDDDLARPTLQGSDPHVTRSTS
jgi:hypothetical protein